MNELSKEGCRSETEGLVWMDDEEYNLLISVLLGNFEGFRMRDKRKPE